jgi:hypothetical protein
MGLTRGITPSPFVPEKGIAGEGGKAMRKVLIIPHYDLPYDEEQGLFFVVPYVKYSPLNKEDYVEFGHHSIVVVPENSVELDDLVGYPEDNPEWASFWSYEGTYEEEEFLDLPFVAEIPMEGVLILEGSSTGKRILVVLEKVWDDPKQFKEGSPFRELLLREGFAGLEPPSLEKATVLLGGDPEFEVVDLESGEIIPAYRVDVFDEGGDKPSSEMGTDGNDAIAEIRPRPCRTPEGYVQKVRSILEFIKRKAPWIDLSVEGNKYPLGGHIHVGARDDLARRVLKEKVSVFIEALDDFVGRVLLPTSGAARGKYAKLFAYEIKPYGWEYRTPPASIYGDLEALRITYKLTKGLVEKILRERKFSYEVGEDRIPPLREYLVFLTEEEARYFLDFPRRWKEGLVPRTLFQAALAVAE